MGAELFHMDEQTDKHDEANIRISEFCENVYQTVYFKSLGIWIITPVASSDGTTKYSGFL